jgi:aryl-alcohol dehydrogenase-like predicted oxidoreductase
MTFAAADGIWKPIAGVEQRLADELVRLSLDAGVNFIDTADAYSNGESEKVVAQAIANLGIARQDIVIATKTYGRTGPDRRRDSEARRGKWSPRPEALGLPVCQFEGR